MVKRKTRKTQTGKTNLARDRKLSAKPIGKRVSKSGGIYYEYRRNRTDVRGIDSPVKRRKKAVKKKYGYVVRLKSGITDGRIYKTEGKAVMKIAGVIKNNSLSQRVQTGFIGMKVKKIRLNEREIMEMRKVKNFIRS